MKLHKSKEVKIGGKEHKRKVNIKSEKDNNLEKNMTTVKNEEKINDSGTITHTNLVELSEYCKQNETPVSSDVSRKKHKDKKKKLSLLLNDNSEVAQISTNDFSYKKKKKSNFKRMYTDDKTIKSENHDELEPPKKKKMLLNLTTEEYKPGMLSDILQKKKYGSLILPWDPTFGLDPKYKSIPSKTEDNGQKPKLKINPLFDLSKRSDGNATSSCNVENAIFVGNLPKKIKIKELKKIFKKCGSILRVKKRCEESKYLQKFTDLKNNLNHHNKSANAVINFQNLESCKKALKMNGELFEGHHLRVTLAKDEGAFDAKKSVFVGNVAFRAQDDDLWKVFESCGEIESVRVVRDTQTGKGRGFGYVNFKTVESIEKALLLDNTPLLERNIRVSRNQSDSKSLSNSIRVKRKKRKKFIPGSNMDTKRKFQSTKILPDDKGELGENKQEKQKSKKFHSLDTEPSVQSKLKKKKKKSKKKLDEES